MKLIGQLKLTGKSRPTRRVWIPKPGKDEKRPLGIPTIHDRALQGVVKAALEPEWEARFEASSYGFRPGRSCHDAIKHIKYVKVKGDKSPYDGDLVYWSTRMGRNPELPDAKAILLKKQKGKCNWCGLYFRNGDLMEKDHILATALGGKDEFTNYQLLHGKCHNEKTAIDLDKIREKRASDFIKKLFLEWSKVNFVWINDIPVLIES